MNSDASSLQTSNSSRVHNKNDGQPGEFRKKRAAALSAQSIWRNGLIDPIGLLPTTTMNLRNHSSTSNFHEESDDLNSFALSVAGPSGLNNKRQKVKIASSVSPNNESVW